MTDEAVSVVGLCEADRDGSTSQSPTVGRNQRQKPEAKLEGRARNRTTHAAVIRRFDISIPILKRISERR